MRVALVHDFLTQDGGAERVLKTFCEVYPKSPVFTLFYDPKKMGHIFAQQNIQTSFLNKLPFIKNKYHWYLPLMPAATENYNLENYDVVLSSASALAKGVITQPNTMHLCYCHTPTRYLWSHTHSYVNGLKYGKLVKTVLPLVLNSLRLWDKIAAERVDYFIANSRATQARIKKYYNRDSEIIYPPVDTHKYYISPKINDYFLTGGRLVAHKRFDIAVTAFSKMNIKLKIFGTGPELKRLKKIAGHNIEFLEQIPENEKTKLYAKAKAFVHPQEEDWGITAVESMASGRPVIAYHAGGALETVVENKTGKFFNEQTWESLADTVIRFDHKNFNPQEIKKYSGQFRTERFRQEIEEHTKIKWQQFQQEQGFTQQSLNI